MNDKHDGDAAPSTLFGKFVEVLSDSAVYGLSTVLTQLVGFLLLPIYTRHLTPADYGVLAMMNVLTLTYMPLASLCVVSGAYRRLQSQPNEEARKTVLSTSLAGVLVITCVALAVGWTFAEWPALWLVGSTTETPLIRITLVSAALAIVGETARIDLRSRRRTRTVAMLNLAGFLVTLTLTIRFVVFDNYGARGVVWGGLGGALFGLIAGLAATRDRFPLRFDTFELQQMLKYGLPIVPHRLVGVGLAMYSQYYVRELLGLHQAGLFDMAARFALPIGLVINAIQEAWVPYKFLIHARNDRPQEFFRESFTYYLALILYLWVGAAAWGPDALRLMTDTRYHDAASLIALTGLIRIMMGVYLMAGSGIELSDDTRPFVLISVSGLIVVVVVTHYFVPNYGAAGAALSTTAGYLTMSVMARRLAQTRYPIHYDWPRIAGLWGTAIAFVASTYFATGFSLVPRLATAVAISVLFPLSAWLIVGGRREHVARQLHPLEAEAGS